jgi:small nuclear ribonucleoprotein (snRNP)-like protein
MTDETKESEATPFTVTFTYDARARKWEVVVRGAESVQGALEGFNAMLLTARQATPSLAMNRATRTSPGVYVISVGI